MRTSTVGGTEWAETGVSLGFSSCWSSSNSSERPCLRGMRQSDRKKQQCFCWPPHMHRQAHHSSSTHTSTHTHVPHTCAHSPPTPTHSQTSLNIHIKNCIDLFYMYECFACMYDVYPVHAWCPQRSTEDIRSSGTEVRT